MSIQLKTITRMLGQKSIKSAEIYIKANRTAISASMESIKNKIFRPEGTLKSQNKSSDSVANVMTMKVVWPDNIFWSYPAIAPIGLSHHLLNHFL